MADTPNILFIFSDQQRWDTVGCCGAPFSITPQLDRMAAEGVVFDHAFTCQPVCGPARSCLQTGLYATQTGCFRNHIALPRNADTLAKRLGGAGYETAYIGKWHLASSGGPGAHEEANFQTAAVPPERRGGYRDFWLAADALEHTSHGYDGHMFDTEGRRVDFPEGRYRVDTLTDYAIDYLKNRDGGRPFFLFLSFLEPHHQNDHNTFEGPPGSRERFGHLPVPEDLRASDGDWPDEWADYLGACASLDENTGRLRATLAELGIADNTVVIYTSDHGCHFRTRNREYKRSCHDASLRVPMVVCGPGFPAGRRVSDLVSLIDLPPTVLEAGGIAPPDAMRGRSLQGLANGDAAGWPDDVFAQISESHVGRCVRTARWKYSVRAPGIAGSAQPGAERYAEDCLYDLEADPHELNNLAASPAHAAVREELAGRLKRRMAAAGEREPVIEPAET